MDIDFVVTWVDGSDPNWIREKREYELEDGKNDSSEARYRDWGLLKYLFRGFEANAPWVHKIHFVTWGHVPDWLNTNHPKLNVVKHEDFIPKSFLPTFNSNVIDWNLFRIKELSENFVLFNDDTLLISCTQPKDFFNEQPCGSLVLEPFAVVKNDWFFTPATNCAIINSHFNLHQSFKSNPTKWLNPKYGLKNNISTLLMLAYPYCCGFGCWHLPNSFSKNTFVEIWEKEHELLEQTCSHRFRDKTEPNQWLAEAWQYMSGMFAPRNPNYGKAFQLGKIQDNLEIATNYIREKQGKCVCVNDSFIDDSKLDDVTTEIVSAFDAILPTKCSFEL